MPQILLMDSFGPVQDAIHQLPLKLMLVGDFGSEFITFKLRLINPKDRITAIYSGILDSQKGVQHAFTLPINKIFGVWKIIIEFSNNEHVEYNIQFNQPTE